MAPLSRTVVVSGARSMPALEMMRAFKARGMRVVATDSARRPPCVWSSAVDRYARLPSPNGDPEGFAEGVRRLVSEESPARWIPTCEEVFHLACLRDRGGVAIPLLAPSLERLEAAHDKMAFSRLAAGVDLAPEFNACLTGPGDLDALRGRLDGLVLKPVWSRFAERVIVRPTQAEAEAIVPTPSDPWIAQSYLPGEEACTYAVASGGRIIAYGAYLSVHRAGRGATLHFEPCDDPGLRHATGALVEAMAWDGQVAFDLRRDAQGAWKAIECNPRATSGVHVLSEGTLADALLDGSCVAPGVAPRTAMLASAMVAYGLPQALRARRPLAWLGAFASARDVSTAPGDRLPGLGQFVFLGELMATARADGISLLAAATRDLEWNGGSRSGALQPRLTSGVPEA